MNRRDQIAEVLPETLGPVGLRHRAVPALGVEGSVTGFGDVLLDALLPLVNRLCAEAAAEVLEHAADELFTAFVIGPVGQDALRARAAAVNPSKEQQP